MPSPGPCYVYVHRHADDEEIFYVGKGTGNRAWSRANRNRWWKFVASKHGFCVEIVQSGLSEYDAHTLEIWLIANLKREGRPLCNLTDGGEGRLGHASSRRKTVYCSNGKTFPSTLEAASWLQENGFAKASGKSITAACLGHKSMVYGHRWSYKKCPPAQKIRPVLWNARPVFCSNGMRFQTASDAALWLGKPADAGCRISRCCHGKRLTAYGYTWAFSPDKIPDYKSPRERTETAKRKPVVCSNGMEFPSRTDAVAWGKSMGLRLSTARIIACIKNPSAKNGGLYWRDKNDA